MIAFEIKHTRPTGRFSLYLSRHGHSPPESTFVAVVLLFLSLCVLLLMIFLSVVGLYVCVLFFVVVLFLFCFLIITI